jgi:hypothetical protein
MPKPFREALAVLMILVMTPAFIAPVSLLAADHVVNAAELHEKLVAAAQSRQANLAAIERFVSREPVQKALNIAGMDTAKARQAAQLLGDEELAKLAARAAQYDRDFAAGALNNQQITYILIALGAALITLILVH